MQLNSQVPTLDREFLSQYSELGDDGISDLLGELYTRFQKNFENGVKEITSALDNGDIKRIERTAHTLRSSAGYVGAARLSQLFSTLDPVDGKSPLEIQEVLGGIEREYLTVHQELSHFLKGL